MNYQKQKEEIMDLGIQVMSKMAKILLLTVFVTFTMSCNKKVVTTVQREKEIKTDNTLYDLTYVEAIKQKMLGNYGDAVKYLEEAIIMNPQSDAAYFQISQLSAMRRDMETAKRYNIKALEISPDNTWYLLNLANIYMQENKIDSVVYCYDRVITIDASREDIKFQLGGLLLETGDYDMGLGFSVLSEKTVTNDARSAGSYSGGGYFSTAYWIDPETDIIALLFLQLYPFNDYDIHKKFEDIVYEIQGNGS